MACDSTKGFVGVLCHEPLVELRAHLCLERLIIPNVDRLTKPGAAARYEFDLDTKCLDGVNNQRHHMNTEHVKEDDRDDSFGHNCNIRFEDKRKSIEHDLLIEPCFVVQLVQ